MKKTWLTIIAAVLVAAVVFAPTAGPEAQAATIQLTYSVFFPSSPGQTQAGAAWARVVAIL